MITPEDVGVNSLHCKTDTRNSSEIIIAWSTSREASPRPDSERKRKQVQFSKGGPPDAGGGEERARLAVAARPGGARRARPGMVRTSSWASGLSQQARPGQQKARQGKEGRGRSRQGGGARRGSEPQGGSSTTSSASLLRVERGKSRSRSRSPSLAARRVDGRDQEEKAEEEETTLTSKTVEKMATFTTAASHPRISRRRSLETEPVCQDVGYPEHCCVQN